MSAATGLYLGYNGKTYYLASGTRTSWGTVTNGVATATAPAGLTEMSCIRDIEDSTAYNVVDGSTRATGKFDVAIAAKLKIEYTLTVPWQPADAGFAALHGAYTSNTTIALAILDGPSTQTGVSGIWADFLVTEFPRPEPEADLMVSKVKITPGFSAVPPQSVAVT